MFVFFPFTLCPHFIPKHLLSVCAHAHFSATAQLILTAVLEAVVHKDQTTRTTPTSERLANATRGTASAVFADVFADRVRSERRREEVRPSHWRDDPITVLCCVHCTVHLQPSAVSGCDVQQKTSPLSMSHILNK